jgi:hypothetical protein
MWYPRGAACVAALFSTRAVAVSVQEVIGILTACSTMGGSFLEAVPLIWEGLFATGWSGSRTVTGVTLGEQPTAALCRDMVNKLGRAFNGLGSSETGYTTFMEMSHECLDVVSAAAITPPVHVTLIRYM